MAIIITHSGSAHLDDFLSCCLVMNKFVNITKIKRKEPNTSEINDPTIWKLDVGEKYDPKLKCYDHHQDDIVDDCTLSLLLKDWGIWSIANEVHNWLDIVIMNDTRGPIAVKKKLRINSKAMGFLDSFVERTILDYFKEKEEITKESFLFSLMEIIGQNFFELIELYATIIKQADEKLEYKMIKGVQTIFFYRDLEHSSTLTRIIRDKMRENWPKESGGIAVYPNKRVKGSIAIKRFDNDKRVDFSRISHYKKVIYSHPKGFFISVEKMTQDHLEQYIKDAIKN